MKRVIVSCQPIILAAGSWYIACKNIDRKYFKLKIMRPVRKSLDVGSKWIQDSDKLRKRKKGSVGLFVNRLNNLPHKMTF